MSTDFPTVAARAVPGPLRSVRVLVPHAAGTRSAIVSTRFAPGLVQAAVWMLAESMGVRGRVTQITEATGIEHPDLHNLAHRAHL